MAAKDRTLQLKLRAVDQMSAAIDRVQRRFPKLTRSIERGARVTKIFNAQTRQMRAVLNKVGGSLQSFGRTLTIGVTLPLLAAGAASIKFFGDFEQGLKGIEKTTGITGSALEKLGQRFDNLSTTIPVTSREMLELAKAGGQLGIQGVDNLEKFTVVMAKLSRASDVAGEAGAKSIARILTVTGTDISQVDRFSAALVDLGNNAAASESEILEVATRVAGQIGRFDVASDKVLGIATALKALGKTAESSGSVIGRAFDSIDQSIKKGGDSVLLLSKLTGIATKDLKQQFSIDATNVFQKFVFGLSKVQKAGGNTTKVLGFLGLQGVRINDILGTLIKRPEVLAKNLDRASKAFRENTALEKEFAIQINSLNSEMITIGNTVVSLAIAIGKDLAPMFSFFGKIFKKVIGFFREHPVIRLMAISLGLVLAVLGPLTLAAGGLLLILPALSAAAIALGVSLVPILGPIAGVSAAILGLTFLTLVVIKKWDKLKRFFNENPFGQLIKFALLVLNPIGAVITAIRLLVASFEGLDAVKDVLKDTIPGLETREQEDKRNIRETPIFDFAKLKKERAIFEKFKLSQLGPQGLDFGGASLGPTANIRQNNKKIIEKSPKENPFKGVLDINFKNAPEGTNVKAKTEGPLNFNLGFAGGLQ